ncbi:MAG: hypothetical protein VKP72_08625 [bacterium]|nr:hypothetical protein [bacterium]
MNCLPVPVRPVHLAPLWLLLITSCQSQPLSPGGLQPSHAAISVRLSPAWKSGRLTQAVVPVRTAGDVKTLEVVPMRREAGDETFYAISRTTGATASVEADDRIVVKIPVSAIGDDTWLAFDNLRPATRYRFQAHAFGADQQIISDPNRSYLDLDLAYETQPVLGNIPVQLTDRVFSATGSIGLRQVAPTKNYDSVLVGLYLPGGLVAVPGATASFPDCTWTVSLTNLRPHTTYWAKAEAVDANGTILSTATSSLVVRDDDQIPAVSLDVEGGPAT